MTAKSATDVFSREKRAEVMRAVKSRDTKPEIALRKALHREGLRYRLHGKGLPGTPDLVFGRHCAVLFVNGCFWHGHDCARGARVPKSNRAYWTAKIARNIARDAQAARALKGLGWRVFIVFECEMKDAARAARRLARQIRSGEKPGKKKDRSGGEKEREPAPRAARSP